MSRFAPILGSPRAQRAVQAIALGFGIGFALLSFHQGMFWTDGQVYWAAGERLRSGEALYPVAGDPEVAYFKYAPWFAWLWIPLTYLPKGLVQVGWSVVLLASVGVALLPIMRVRSVAAVCLAALLGGLLIRTASTGNVHALLVAALVVGAPRRSGPIWIGIAASLKFVPILYALVYVGRRQWRRAGVALLVTVVLLAPALLQDLRGYPADPGDSLSLLSFAGPVPWAVLALICAGVALALARGRHAWAAASVAVLAAIPRLQLYDVTYLLVGLDGRRQDE
jgi:hypothetical protein